ncbi:cyclin-D1-binding protein 1 homolog [Osmerus mordax]|uniref:cyclin-D1-binding protein 1 homolog n=1 Tax=Osmerus mordax TaxID=8014 RepID=UPI003510CC7E
MSADNSFEDLTVPLRNLLNSVQCVRDRVKDGESNESNGGFNLANFWDTLNQAAKAVSQEATKLSLAFSKPPQPSQDDVEILARSMQKSVLSLSTVYYWLPKSQGISLRRLVRDATLDGLDGVIQLVEVLLSSPLQSLSQEQLSSTGGVWLACDQFAHLPSDNQAAVGGLLSSHLGVVKDAIEEMEQARAESVDPLSNELEDEDEEEPRGNMDTYWSERDRQVLAPCGGLMKTAAACLRKLSAAVKASGSVATPQTVAQLDDLADVTKMISPGVDDLALTLYPPMDYSGVENNACQLASILKKVLEIIRSSHVCLEADLTWVQFLERAVEHNLHKIQDLVQVSI